MSFEEKLKKLRIQGIGEEAARRQQARIDSSIQRRLEQLGREKNKEELERLEGLTAEKISPTLEVAKEAYLGKRGVISQDEEATAIPIAVALKLEWDYNPRGISRYDNELRVALDANLMVKIRGAGRESPIIELSLEDQNFQEQLEDGIASVLGTPDACSTLFIC